MNDEKPIGISYFYFEYIAQDRQSIEGVAACLLKQLVSETKIGVLPSILEKMYDDGIRPNYSTIVDLIHSCSNRFNPVYIFLDGLDESKDKGLTESFISDLHSPLIRLFLTARLPLVKPAGEYVSLNIDGKDVDADIRKYVDEELRKAKIPNADFGPIGDKVVGNVRGM